MELLTIALSIVAFLSEMLPLLGFTKANGVIHGFKTTIMHCHAESDCNVIVENK
jgi:hypothetical protein